MATPPGPSAVKRLDAPRVDAIDLLAFDLVPRRALRPGDLVLCTVGDTVCGAAVAGAAEVVESVVRSGYLVVRVG